jgi:serine phosphatase RsbU (regulator of sigma subunit)
MSMMDLERAHAIQTAAMTMNPDPDPRLSIAVRYTPNDVVGGDFYHYEKLCPDLLGVMIADVMGHGVASALYSMQLSSLWEDWRGEAGNPATFLTHINRQLHSLAGDAGYFATAVCLTIDPSTGAVDFICAGHPAPLQIRREGGIQAVGAPQPALGMIPNTVYTAEHLHMSPGDTLLLYTDGAIEIDNASGDELGESGLITMLSKPETCQDGIPQLDILENKLLTFSARIRLADDLTLLSITRR